MPLVFVHGVNVRDDSDYYADLDVRDGYFRRFALDGVVSDASAAKILNPYWGKDAASFRWNHASLPDDSYESFGQSDAAFEEIVAEIAPGLEADPDRIALTAAREHSLAAAVDLVWAAAAHTELPGEDPDALASTARQVAAYADDVPNPAWLATVQNDDQFLSTLLDEAEKHAEAEQKAVESFGLGDIVNRAKVALGNLANSVTGTLAAKATGTFRPWLNQRFSLFLGDIFVYLDERGDAAAPGPIVEDVVSALDAATKTPQDDKLIVVAHSMGGNVVYDILTYFRPDISVDLLLTVGSQVGLFEELKLFRSSDDAIPSPAQKTVPMPANVARWINVFDPADVLGFATSRIFAGTEDFKFATGSSTLSAHSMYFFKPMFYQRMRRRVLKLDS